MNKQFLLINFALLVLIFAFWTKSTSACTVLIAGKETTADSAIYFGKTEDDGGHNIDYLWHFPRKEFKESAFLAGNLEGLEIAQQEMTYEYFFDQCPPTSYSNMVVNEWGVTFGSNGCRSKEDPAEELKKRGQIEKGGIGFMLRIILAQRAKTAREAVELAAELIDKYGYRASGRNLNIVGPDEAWQLQMVRGKHYVARRVQDDEVAIISNTYSIREVDLNDDKNFIASPDLIEYARERGWYDPQEDGEFDFAKAYADEQYHVNNSNNHRQWILAKALNPAFSVSLEEAEKGEMPVAFKPGRKLELEDFMNVLRNHYEGTQLNEEKDQVDNPHHLPHTVCRNSTHKATVVQQRDYMPQEIGTVIWRALGQPCQSVFVPWYLGLTEIPEEYQKKEYHRTGKIQTELVKDQSTNSSLMYYHFNFPKGKHEEIDIGSASGAFTLLNKISDADYKQSYPVIRDVFDPLENQWLQSQKEVEEKALRLYEKDEKRALEYLTNYTQEQAEKAYNEARKLCVKLIEL
ncbi:MAG: C69 family dipeptidase [Bacteroidales bacterium]